MSIEVFISHHTNSSLHITEAICNYFESNFIRCWYAPRNSFGPYANTIAEAINECKVFVLVLNQEASFSPDVLNEIYLATERYKKGDKIEIIPFKVAEEEISNDARYYIGRLHWIDAVTPPLIERIKDLYTRVNNILSKDINNQPNVQYKSNFKKNFIYSGHNFVGRNKELELIDKALKKDRIVFLYGIGGNGKTKLAQEYAELHINEFDNIIFAQYESSLQNLIISDKYFHINGLERLNKDGKFESDEDYCIRKLKSIKASTTNNTLIILDNFDTDEDPLLEEFLDGLYNIIITTRNNFDYLGMAVVLIKNMTEEEQLLLFKQNYKRPITDENIRFVKSILKQLYGHTLAIELVAKLMSTKRIKPEKMMELLKKEGISPEEKGKVHHGFEKSETVYNHIKKLFSLDKLNEDEIYVLSNLALYPMSGVSADSFIDWCEIEDGSVIYELIDRSWIMYDINTDHISLHPVIADVVKNELDITLKKCSLMLKNLNTEFKATWSMGKSKKAELGEIAKNLYYRFNETTKENYYIFRNILCVFLNLDYYEIAENLINDFKTVIGEEDSLELAWLCYDYGDFMLRYQNYDSAEKYFLKGCAILERIYPESYDLAYIYKHLAHTYHAIYNHLNADPQLITKARIYLDESERIFNEAVKDPEKQWGSIYYSYGLNLEKEHAAQRASRYYAYGLNYYYSQDYEMAEEFSNKSLEIFISINDEEDSDTTAPMRVLSMIYSKTNRFDDAINMQKRVISARSKLWEKYQYRYFEQFETLADIYFEAGMIEESIEELRKIVEYIEDSENTYNNYYNRIKFKIEKYSITKDG